MKLPNKLEEPPPLHTLDSVRDESKRRSKMHPTFRNSVAAVLVLGALGLHTSAARAASSDVCAAYATQEANDYNRGLVGNVLTLPLDVTGALLTGRTTHDGERDRVYRAAFAECMAGDRVVVLEPDY
jgi:hypothetical protein